MSTPSSHRVPIAALLLALATLPSCSSSDTPGDAADGLENVRLRVAATSYYEGRPLPCARLLRTNPQRVTVTDADDAEVLGAGPLTYSEDLSTGTLCSFVLAERIDLTDSEFVVVAVDDQDVTMSVDEVTGAGELLVRLP